ncbi:MAG TPA: PilZ domain-containing protein [Nitrospiraceae bacterium]|nr:PilZ domain-containing protein [Nitrospiraceae bacterium]
MQSELRQHPRLRILAPFVCVFSRTGLVRWLSADREGLGVVLDVSLKGARVMSAVTMTPGDQLAVSLRLPNQISTMNADATVRWGNDQTFGLEFAILSRTAETRLRKYLTQTSSTQLTA